MITSRVKINPLNPEPEIIALAADIIKSGGLVAFPTETVYGLGANALDPESVSKIYRAKGRPSDNPLILHVSDLSQAESLLYMNEKARMLAKRFWPGALTLVLPARNIIPLKTRGGLETAAIRCPNNVIALELIRASGVPIAAPSANTSGRPSPTDSDSVYQDMNGKIDLILDSDSIQAIQVGIESTVIDVSDPDRVLLLRPGGMPRSLIESALNMKLERPDPDSESDSKKRSPGTRYKHYAPSIPVIILGKDKDKDIPDSAGYMGVHEPAKKFAREIIFNSYDDYARGLFSGFRELEGQGLPCIIVEWPEDDSGINEGLRDRIIRAAGNN
ncbi:MAG: threonylcarbamoyl-AMP synthase [Synergistaceae bacterium]|nr:threonylcarbamoyl-AMP synthase [Synergistaceae bacterium]